MMETAYGKTVQTNITQKVREVRKEITSNKTSETKLQVAKNKATTRLADAKRKYTNAHYEMEDASNSFKLIGEDGNSSRNDQEKARLRMDHSVQVQHDTKSGYAAQVQAFNQEQEEHFSTHLPELLNRWQVEARYTIGHIGCSRYRRKTPSSLSRRSARASPWSRRGDRSLSSE
jgi:hypothetical protein